MNTRITFCATLLIVAVAFLPGCAKKDLVRSTQEPSIPTFSTLLEQENRSAGKKDVVQETINETAVKEESEFQVKSPDAADIKSGLETIYFDFDSFGLAPSAREALYRNYQWLKSNPALKIRVEGHSDERGAGEYNLALGEKRAKAAMQYLITLGILPERLNFVSYGEEKPATSGHDESFWSKNRRAEFFVLPEK